MARPKQDGLSYFSFDTDFFYADRRIRALISRYKSKGIMLYIYLLTEIYRNGYFARWDDDITDYLISLGLTEGLIEQIMTFLVGRSLLVKSTLANSDTIITSPGIQKRFQEAIKSKRRDIFVNQEIWLLSKEETAAYIKFTINDNKSGKNDSKSGENDDKSGKNPLKEIKINKIKENNHICVTRFGDFFSAYPKQRNLVAAEREYCLLLFNDQELTEEELIDAAKNYAEAVSILGREERYIKNPERFLKDGTYVDYLEKNYIRPNPSCKKNGNKFNQFEQNNYDFDELEKELLSNATD